jgi:hypothetical protein
VPKIAVHHFRFPCIIGPTVPAPKISPPRRRPAFPDAARSWDVQPAWWYDCVHTTAIKQAYIDQRLRPIDLAAQLQYAVYAQQLGFSGIEHIQTFHTTAAPGGLASEV